MDALLLRIQAGDAAAFATWLAAAELPVRRSLRRFAADVDTEAVVQEALLRAWHFAPRVTPDGRGDSLLRYTVRVARNLAVDELRRQGRQVDEPVDDAPDVTPEPPDPFLRRALQACVRALTGKPAEAMQARLGSDGALPDVDLARGLGMTLNTFLQNVTRARRALAACLRRAGVDLPGATP